MEVKVKSPSPSPAAVSKEDERPASASSGSSISGSSRSSSASSLRSGRLDIKSPEAESTNAPVAAVAAKHESGKSETWFLTFFPEELYSFVYLLVLL
jgi:hypothetical protein